MSARRINGFDVEVKTDDQGRPTLAIARLAGTAVGVYNPELSDDDTRHLAGGETHRRAVAAAREGYEIALSYEIR